MAYATKYILQCRSLHDVDVQVLIQADGYTGDPITRSLAKAPVLRKEDGGSGICGTSLAITAECIVDEEFAELYTSDAREFLVLVKRGTNVIWRGFIVPELYAEPDVAPPYDVDINATDGLGELKSYTFEDEARRSVGQHIVNLLAYTGLAPSLSDLVIVSTLASQSPAVTELLNAQICAKHLVGKNCYDALSVILTTFNMTLTQHNGAWLLVRETDLSRSLLTVPAKNGNGTAVALPVGDIGSASDHDWWPVGRLERVVVPAKNSVSVDLPFQFRESLFNNASFADGTISGWTGSGVTFAPSTYGVNKPVISPNGGYIQQSVQVAAYSGRLSLKFLAATIQANIGWLEAKTLKFKMQLSLSASGTTYWLSLDQISGFYWATQQPDMDFTLTVINGNGGRILIENDFTETAIENIPGFPAAGTLSFKITNTNSRDSVTLVLGGVYLTVVLENGYRDEVVLDNNAREMLDTVTLGFGDAPYGLTIPSLTLLNYIETSGGAATSAWKTSRISAAREFISLMALDYAMLNALPRLKVTGKLNVPTVEAPAFFFTGNLLFFARTYEFDLWNDELTVELYSQPAVSLTVQSEKVRTLDNEEYREVQQSTGGSTAGSSAGSGGGNRGGGTNLAFEERMGMIVQGSGTNDLTVLLDPQREIPITNQMVKNDYPSANAVKQIVACPEYPPVELNGTLYLLIEEVE